MLVSFPDGSFGWYGRSGKGKGLKYHCSVLAFQPAVPLTVVVPVLRTFRYLSATFGNTLAHLSAPASPLPGGCALFGVGGTKTKVRPEHPTSIQ